MNFPTLALEFQLLKQYQTVVAIDEVGRGPWAGPLVLGVIRLDQSFLVNHVQQEILSRVRDSKQLSPKQRTVLAAEIQQNFSGRIFSVSSQEIDQGGVQLAQSRAVNRVVEQLFADQTFFLLDLMRGLRLAVPHQMVVKGDSKHASIAAASIIAKVWRDAFMVELHGQDPRFGFDQHKGYGTKLHQDRLDQYGPSAQHRFSFKPIARSAARHNRLAKASKMV